MNRCGLVDIWNTVFIIAIVLLLQGCTSSRPVVELFPEIPENWSFENEIKHTPISKGILEQIENVDLRRFIEKVAQRNPDLESAYARLMVQRSQIGLTKSPLFPAVSASVSRSQNNQTIDSVSGEVGKGKTHSLGLLLHWEIDLFGKLKDNYNASLLSVEASEWRFYAVKESIVARSIQQWIHAASLQQSLEIAGERIITLKAIQQRISKRYENGLGDLSELDAARMRLALGEVEFAQIKDSYERSIRILQNLSGEQSSENWDFVPEFFQIEIPEILSPQQVLFNRPDVQIALNELQSSILSHRSAKKGHFPTLLLQGNFGKESIRIEDFLDAGNVWGWVFSVTKKLFDGGSLKSQIETSFWETRMAESELKNVILRASLEIQNAIAEETRSENQLVHLTVAERSAARSFEYYEKRYLDGLDPIVLMLNAKEEHLSIQTQLNEMEAMRIANRIQTILALGYGDRSINMEEEFEE